MGFGTAAVAPRHFSAVKKLQCFRGPCRPCPFAMTKTGVASWLLLLRCPLASESFEGGVMTPEPMRANDEVLRRVQGEFLEMPGLRLTEAQARRLWGLDAASCGALLGALVDAKFLFRTRDGAFMRVEHATPVKATLKSRATIAAA